jgi:ATP-dependent helicase/nuclease subunit A
MEKNSRKILHWGSAPPAYLRQLALYRAVLRRIYPDRSIRAALVWTDVPDLMEISAEAMDRALTSP